MSRDSLNDRIDESRRSYADEPGEYPFGQPVEEDLSEASSYHSMSVASNRTSDIRGSLINSDCPSTDNEPIKPRSRIDECLIEIAEKHEISHQLSQHLRALEDYEIIIVCDDSGSMKTTVDNTTRTRWDELCEIVKIVLEIGVVFDSSGVDLYFLNRSPILNVTDPTTVDREFLRPPRGYTPMVTRLQEVFQLPAARRGNDKKMLVFVATDGAPTDVKGNINVHELKRVMNEVRRVETTFVQFLICTDDPTCVDYLVKWDQDMKNVDVTDDFHSERERVWKNRGREYPFSRGDYIVKALLGAIVPQFDNLND